MKCWRDYCFNSSVTSACSLVFIVRMLFFSRRFTREKSRLYSWLFVSVFKFFFRHTWSDQNSSTPKVLQNFRKPPKCTRWPKELSQKGFPRNIQYRTRPKGPPFQFFGIVRLFFKVFLFIKGSPIHQ